MTMRPALAGVAAVALAGLACTETTELVSASGECVAPGPIVHLGGIDDASCAPALASRLSRYAVCTCQDLVVTGGLSVSSLPGSSLPGTVPAPPGAVGMNGYALIWGPTNLSGALVVAGAEGVRIAGGSIAGNIHSGGGVATLAPVWVSGDVFSNGNLNGPYGIMGALHLPASATVDPAVGVSTIAREPVTVASPCPCGGPPSFDIAAAVAARGAKNANASLAFSSAFLDEIDSTQTFNWPCGEFYVAGLRTGPQAALEFRIHGQVGIFVDGDVRLGNNLNVTFDDDASSLDLVVAGSFFTTGRVFGSPMQPSRMRLWVGSTTVSLPDQIQFGAVVNAPLAVFSAGVGVTINGSLFVQRISAASDVNLLYDPGVAANGLNCGISAPPPVE